MIKYSEKYTSLINNLYNNLIKESNNLLLENNKLFDSFWEKIKKKILLPKIF